MCSTGCSGRWPRRRPVSPKGAGLTGRCQPRFGVVFRHADDDDAASHEKIVSSLLFYTVLELGLKGCGGSGGGQRSRQKEPPGEGGAGSRSLP